MVKRNLWPNVNLQTSYQDQNLVKDQDVTVRNLINQLRDKLKNTTDRVDNEMDTHCPTLFCFYTNLLSTTEIGHL